MRVTQIQVHAGRTFNHPYEQYSNFKPGLTLVATLDEGEDAIAATKKLQAQAEELAEEHKNALLTSIKELWETAQIERDMIRLGEQIEQANARLAQLREERAKAPAQRSLLLGAAAQENVTAEEVQEADYR